MKIEIGTRGRSPVVLAILIALAVGTAHPAFGVSAGQKCSSKGQQVRQQGKTFVCSKVGSRLIWKVKTSSAQPAPVATVPAWPTVNGKYRNEANAIRNAFVTARDYKDARLYLETCTRLKDFIASLPSTAPNVYLLQSGVNNCVDSTPIGKIYEWMMSREVMNVPDCIADPGFRVQVLRTYDSPGFTGDVRVEFSVSATLQEPLGIWSAFTNYPRLYETNLVVEPPNKFWDANKPVLIPAGTTKILGVDISGYNFREGQKAGLGLPIIKQLNYVYLDPKYGDRFECNFTSKTWKAP